MHSSESFSEMALIIGLVIAFPMAQVSHHTKPGNYRMEAGSKHAQTDGSKPGREIESAVKLARKWQRKIAKENGKERSENEKRKRQRKLAEGNSKGVLAKECMQRIASLRKGRSSFRRKL
jgi:hypothetical protein